MKAAQFEYVRPDTLDALLTLLNDGKADSTILAGGQTLIPLMAARLAMPERLIDVARIAELQCIEKNDSVLKIGAGTRQSMVLTSDHVSTHAPLLALGITHVGHRQTRNRGTIGGSLCTADPSAEIPLVASVLDATLHLRSQLSNRSLAVDEFITGPMTTCLEVEECLIHISIPLWDNPQNTSFAFKEVSARAGDFAIVSAAVQLQLLEGGICERIACGVGGASGVPVRAIDTEQALTGNKLANRDIETAARFVGDRLDASDDNQASAGYRERVAPVLLARTIKAARDKALARQWLESGDVGP